MVNIKKIVSVLLILCMCFGLGACGNKETAATEPEKDYNQISNDLYNENLGEFVAAYEKALETSNNSERFGLMAIAEAKFLESAVFLPLYAIGGTYSISSVAPYTVPNVFWGTDRYRYKNALVTKESITVSDREAMLSGYSIVM